jgi:hypothetical protein
MESLNLTWDVVRNYSGRGKGSGSGFGRSAVDFFDAAVGFSDTHAVGALRDAGETLSLAVRPADPRFLRCRRGICPRTMQGATLGRKRGRGRGDGSGGAGMGVVGQLKRQ